MKKIEFVRLKSTLKGYGLGKGVKYNFENTREIIEEKAKEGFSYYGFVPVEQRGTGEATIIDLIFEKDE